MSVPIERPATTSDWLQFLHDCIASGGLPQSLPDEIEDSTGNAVQRICRFLRDRVANLEGPWVVLCLCKQNGKIVADVYEHPSEDEAISSDPNTTTRAKKRQQLGGSSYHAIAMLDSRIESRGQINHQLYLDRLLDEIETAAGSLQSDTAADQWLKALALASEQAIASGLRVLTFGWRRKSTQGDELDFSSKGAANENVAKLQRLEMQDDLWTTMQLHLVRQELSTSSPAR